MLNISKTKVLLSIQFLIIIMGCDLQEKRKSINSDSSRFEQNNIHRSTYYNGNVDIWFKNNRNYNKNASISIEAWVYRERDIFGCETIVSNGGQYLNSFWFGICPKLRFTRSGNDWSTSTEHVPLKTWTHVTVTFDSKKVRFYINGKPSGTFNHSYSNLSTNNMLRLGGSKVGDYSYARFNGYLDEVRIWSIKRSENDIFNNMLSEIDKSDKNLTALFPEGGFRIIGSDNRGNIFKLSETDTPPKLVEFGVLPLLQAIVSKNIG